MKFTAVVEHRHGTHIAERRRRSSRSDQCDCPWSLWRRTFDQDRHWINLQRKTEEVCGWSEPNCKSMHGNAPKCFMATKPSQQRVQNKPENLCFSRIVVPLSHCLRLFLWRNLKQFRKAIWIWMSPRLFLFQSIAVRLQKNHDVEPRKSLVTKKCSPRTLYSVQWNLQ